MQAYLLIKIGMPFIKPKFFDSKSIKVLIRLIIRISVFLIATLILERWRFNVFCGLCPTKLVPFDFDQIYVTAPYMIPSLY